MGLRFEKSRAVADVSQSSEAKRLRALGFDGLYHPDPAIECGCYLDDLRPCGEIKTGCRGGFEVAGLGIFGSGRKSGGLQKNRNVAV